MYDLYNWLGLAKLTVQLTLAVTSFYFTPLSCQKSNASKLN